MGHKVECLSNSPTPTTLPTLEIAVSQQPLVGTSSNFIFKQRGPKEKQILEKQEFPSSDKSKHRIENDPRRLCLPACLEKCPSLEKDTGRQPSGGPGPSTRMKGEKLPAGLTGQLMCLGGGSTGVENL